MIILHSVGLDVAMKEIAACISTMHEDRSVRVKSTTKFSNTLAGFKKLEQWIRKWISKNEAPVRVCMEATGVYHENCAYYLSSNGFEVSIILPNRAKHYLKSLGNKSKNDKIDAIGLARMGAEQKLSVWKKPSEALVELRSLTRQHQAIQEDITAVKNRLHAQSNAGVVCKEVVAHLKAQIKFLQKQKDKINKAIVKLIENNPKLSSRIKEICKVRGLRVLSVATVVSETFGFELFENYRQLVSYAGYDVIENQSGQHHGKTKISKKGNSRIRRILHMPALAAIRDKESKLGQLHTRIFEKTGIKMKSVVAVQKKLLLQIYFKWKEMERSAHDNNSLNRKLTSLSETIAQEKKVATSDVATQARYALNKSIPALNR